MEPSKLFLLDISKQLEDFCFTVQEDECLNEKDQVLIKSIAGTVGKSAWSRKDKCDILAALSGLLYSADILDHFLKFLPRLLPEIFARLFYESATKRAEECDWLVLNTLEKFLSYSNSRMCKNSITNYLKVLSERVTSFGKEKTVLQYFEVTHKWCRMLNIVPDAICKEEILIYFKDSKNEALSVNVHRLLAITYGTVDVDSFLFKKFDRKDILKYNKDCNVTHFELQSNLYVGDVTTANIHRSFDINDFISNFIPFFGLPFEVDDEVSKSAILENRNDIILTKTTLKNLKSLIYGYLCNQMVLLSGDIGSGKTSIVELFAQFLGRTKSPKLLKLQLGEQTDSKSLLGTYICSDTPGEFVWQTGTLSQAVQLGSWILLEDIDQAPSDVISTLMTLLKSRQLSIPGHGKTLLVHPGFQIFATKRVGYGQRNSVFNMLLKESHVINMESSTKEELIEIVSKKFGTLSSIAGKMVDVYCMLSMDHSLESENDVQLLNASNRKNTPRDLFKWCERLHKYFKISNTNPTVEFVYLHALQCFCSATAASSGREAVAYALGGKLGLSKEKVEYYLTKYKPDIKTHENLFSIGNTTITRITNSKLSLRMRSQNFAFTKHSVRLLEDIAASVKHFEPVLLVGETGGGKTSTIQYLADQCGFKLNVVNMSQQSDIADLLGGFKPIDVRETVRSISDAFIQLFIDTYSKKENTKFLGHVSQCFAARRWNILIKLMNHCCLKAASRKQREDEEESMYNDLKQQWKDLEIKIKTLETKIASQTGLVFSFVEGVLVKSLVNGDWILLDEINLASTETLECLSGLLDSASGSAVLSERGDIEEIKRNESFRLFACMNPATDIGKKDLPFGIRNRFTEIYVDELSDEGDLKTLVASYLKQMNISSAIISGIVLFYLSIRQLAKDKLVDGSGHRPHFSLRTLCRGLEYAIKQTHMTPMRAVYEGLCTSFLTQLNRASHPIVESCILKHVFNSVKNVKSFLGKHIPQPRANMVNAEGYWIELGKKKEFKDESYVLTESVKKNLKDLARVVAGGRFPILIQGETSVGKTSLISYLAKLSGNQCVRINNHEHTDIQEYIGCYGADDNGNLVFKEGVLVTAMRQGHWIILDELNLAPSDVLEALNRLLDDNRELFIAETQETVKAHPKFILFATQNPPGHYGGRKILSRAFRNRFIELHFDEIPSKELEKILHQRCYLPESYCKKFVKVMHDLQLRRSNSGVFAGKQSFMTLRDLFRWAERYRLSSSGNNSFYDWEQCICEDGYMLIAGRCRRPEESQMIKEVLELNFKKTLDLEKLFNGDSLSSITLSEQILCATNEDFSHIVWTRNMKRLAILAGRALQFNEPILLIGETGCGKTTICQLFASTRKAKLYSVNCHMHTEASDFLGGLRPVRHKDDTDSKKLFEWNDGPLINSMMEGEMFLIDEISLADDSVLERLNSVLEPERMLVLSEKGESENVLGNIDVIHAAEGFRLFATMNPGGDYGKKELSPALRNRFTEVWCSPSDCYDDLKQIIEHNVHQGVKLKTTTQENVSGIGDLIVNFLKWFKDTEVGFRVVVSIRDLLSWVQFINATTSHAGNMHLPDTNKLTAEESYVHGACLVFVDAIGSGNTARVRNADVDSIRKECVSFLIGQVGLAEYDINNDFINTENSFGLQPFTLAKGPSMECNDLKYSFHSKTTKRNALHLLRGLQLSRPILLEGSPGVGKTSLVIALAKASCHPISRINLSEETDISDLFGADLPVEGGEAGQFSWKDGPLLKALKNGHWVVFDELNLASQSVLEGLNSCFDHRAELYLPELNKTFTVQKDTRIFACQNPLHEGGGRKGLPKSFLNRFTKVYVDAMTTDDLCIIVQTSFPNVQDSVVAKMVEFNSKLHNDVVHSGIFGKKGGPWEFNIRDMTRWCELIQHNQKYCAGDYLRLIYQARMRDVDDKEKVVGLYKDIFKDEEVVLRNKTQQCCFDITSSHIKIGYSCVQRNERRKNPMENHQDFEILRGNLPYLECIMKCVEMNWMSILVGGESSCKNSMVQVLSEVTGNHLNILSMNSITDSSDFIGGFEQLNYETHLLKITAKLKETITSLLALHVMHQEEDHRNICVELIHSKNILNEILSDDTGDHKKIPQKINSLKEILSKIDVLACEDFSKTSLDEARKQLSDVEIQVNKTIHSMGQFEWVDGVLVTSLKQGHWLLIQNVNFCSSSILDRLNGLLEPGGVLSLDERGVIDGQIPFVKPHPNFRLFLSMDPKFGEISRAMRNRGVEIYILSESDNVPLDDLDYSLVVKNSHLSQSSINRIRNLALQTNENKISVLKQSCHLVNKLVEHGYEIEQAIDAACEEVCNTKQTEHHLESSSEDVSENISMLLPSLKSWNQSRDHSKIIHSMIPLKLSKDEICSTFSLMLFMEQSSLEEIFLGQLHLQQEGLEEELLAKWNIFTESIGKLQTLRTMPVDSKLCEIMSYPTKMDDLDNSRRLFLLFLFAMLGINPNNVRYGRNSLLGISSSFSQGKTSAFTLPHKSIMFVYPFYHNLLKCIFDEWLPQISYSRQSDFVKILNAIPWLKILIEYLLKEDEEKTVANTSFTLSSLVLHWKWFEEKFLNTLPKSTALDVTVEQLSQLLSEEKENYIWHEVSKTLCRPIALRSLEEEKLLQMVSRCYAVFSDKDDSAFEMKQKFVNAWSDVKLASVTVTELAPVVQDLCQQATIHEQSKQADKLFSSPLLAVLLERFYYTMSSSVVSKLQMNSSLSSSTYQFLTNNGLLYDSEIHVPAYFTIIQQLTASNENSGLVQQYLPHLQSILHSKCRLRDSSIIFDIESDIMKMDQVLLPLSFTFIKLIEQRTRLNDNGIALQMPLKHSEKVFEELSCAHQLVWNGADQISNANKQYFQSQIRDAMSIIINVLKAYTFVNKNEEMYHQLNQYSGFNIVELAQFFETVKRTKTMIVLPKNVGRIIDSLLSWMENCKKDGNTDDEYIAGFLACFSSLVQFHCSKLHLKFDPVEEVSIRRHYLQKQFDDVQQELKIRYSAQNIWTGAPSYNISSDGLITVDHYTSNSEMVQALLERQEILYRELNESKEEDIARPEKNLYSEIYNHFEYFCSTIGSLDTIMDLIDGMCRFLSAQTSAASDTQKVLQKSYTWLKSANQFVNKLENYQAYQDITTLPIVSLKALHNGFLILLNKLKRKMLTPQNSGKSRNAHLNPAALCTRLLETGWNIPMDGYTKLVDPSIFNTAQYLSQYHPETLSHLPHQLLILSLKCLHNHFKADLNVGIILDSRQKALAYFKNIMAGFYQLWCNKKQSELEEEARKSSLYKYKSQVHCEDQSEDEASKELLTQLFPSYDGDYEDLVPKDLLNDDHKFGDKKTEEEPQETRISKVDESLIYQTMKSIFLNSNDEKVGVSTIIMDSFHMIWNLLKIPEVAYGWTSNDNVQSILVVLHHLLGKVTSSNSLCPDAFNIYEDYDIEEATKAKKILVAFDDHLVRLLSEFEDHPALLQTRKLVERMLSLSICSPLMKFATGFELLLKQAQDWEQYAGSHVSLKENLTDLTKQIIEWRKMELKNWQHLLVKSEQKYEESVSKWIFHLWNLLEEIEHAKEEDVLKEKKEQYFTAIRQLFENGTVGDYGARLQLVQVYLKYMQENNFNIVLQNLTWNTLQYYQQFHASIEQYKADSKNPIQKELKDYVKIAKWSDINFYALKLAVEKSHRNLTKFVRKFENILQEPISQFLKDAAKTVKPEESNKTFEHMSSNSYDKACSSLKLVECDDDSYLGKISSLTRKMQKYFKQIEKNSHYGQFIEGVDTFTGDIIQCIQDLQKENPLSLPKEKQKVARTNLQQRKRKALASLFKELRSIGLSYRAGNLSNMDENEIFNLPVVDSRLAFSKHVEGTIEGSNFYHFQSLCRQALFQNGLCNPSKEIGPNEISRFKGLTSHLHLIVSKQRRKLTGIMSKENELRQFVEGLINVYETNTKMDKATLPPQSLTKHWLCTMNAMLDRSHHDFNAYDLLVRSSPQQKKNILPFFDEDLPDYAQNLELVQNIIKSVEESNQMVVALQKESQDMKFSEWKFPLYTWSQWTFMDKCVEKFLVVLKNLSMICQQFAPKKTPATCSLASRLMLLHQDMKTVVEEYQQINYNQKIVDVIDKTQGESVSKWAAKLVEQILISVQNVVKVTEEFDESLVMDEDEIFVPGQLSQILTTKFFHHMSSLSVASVMNNVTSFMNHLKEENQSDKSIAFNVIPLTVKILEMVQFYVFHLTKLHRTSCKMLYVLFGLFTDLLQQGYCSPPEEDENATGEGATEFEDIHDGGLGAGEGVKDVSEQIESEDQVEDTKHEKSEKTEDEEEQKDDMKEEKEGIEMTDDFESKLQDLELESDDDDKSEDEGESEGEEPDKQMGEVEDDNQTKEVDENMWGDESEDENEEKNEQKDEDEKTGAKGQSESELVAKDDNKGEQEGNESEQKEEEKDKEQQINEMDDDNIDEEIHQDDANKENKDGEMNDLPDDLNLDGGEDEGADDDVDEDKLEDKKEEKDENENDGDIEMEETLKEEEGTDDKDDEPSSPQNEKDDKTREIESNEMEEEKESENKDEEPDLEERVQSENKMQQSSESVELAPDDVQLQTSVADDSTTQQQQNDDSHDQGQGRADSQDQQGHFGSSESVTKQKAEKQKGRKRKDFQRSKEERKLDRSENISDAKKKKALDADETNDNDLKDTSVNKSETYQHLKDGQAEHDELIIDNASKEQLEQLEKPQNISNISDDNEEEEEDMEMDEEDYKTKENKDEKNTKDIPSAQGKFDDDVVNAEVKEKIENQEEKTENFEDDEMNSTDIKTDFFTNKAFLPLTLSSMQEQETALQSLRKELEDDLTMWSSSQKDPTDRDSMELWLKYERLTSSLSMQLCEQLRLVIEPTLASKMKGDYRTGKRLNMRKVIPYIASQFRKDKIWLRRTKKNKRDYQIVMAVDDSSSMADNHSKQLAFESIAVISNALRWLEAGELAVCSFGEETKLLHSFEESFNEQAGAALFKQFTFDQKKTKIAHLLKMCTLLFDDSRMRKRTSSSNSVSQLLLIVSDGRGIFLEGKELVQRTAMKAREAGIFIVFLILDDPKNRDSILDIKVPVFKPSGLPEIKPYIDEFPFPFYLLLRDINSLPIVLSDALRQWFELVTQTN